jgi:hypothetical protein
MVSWSTEIISNYMELTLTCSSQSTLVLLDSAKMVAHKCVRVIGIRKLNEIHDLYGESEGPKHR